MPRQLKEKVIKKTREKVSPRGKLETRPIQCYPDQWETLERIRKVTNTPLQGIVRKALDEYFGVNKEA